MRKLSVMKTILSFNYPNTSTKPRYLFSENILSPNLLPYRLLNFQKKIRLHSMCRKLVAEYASCLSNDFDLFISYNGILLNC